MSSYKKFIISLIALATAAAAGLAVFLLMQPNSTNTPSDQHISLTGKITCLPHKNSDQPHTLECAIGLKADNGNYYALKNVPTQYTTVNKSVMVTGITTEDKDNRYDITGTINVNTIQENN